MAGKIEARLTQLGVTLPEAAAAVANYVPTVHAGGLLYVSGQVSRDANGPIHGLLGVSMTAEAGAAAAKTCALALLAQVKAACGGDLDRLKRVVKLTGFVASAPGFADQPRVVNGASDFMVELLGDAGRHARSAVGVAALPMGVAVEIEGIFEIE